MKDKIQNMNCKNEFHEAVVADAATVVDKAKDMLEAEKEKKQKEDTPSVTKVFEGVPMRELIGAPLSAAAEAQEKLASTTWEYFQRIGYKTDENGKPTQETRLLPFDLKRPVEQNGAMTTLNQTVQAPFIGLVSVPSLQIDCVDADFQMEATSSDTEVANTEAEVSNSISVSGKVSSSHENTRGINQTVKYQVYVSASQQPPTEGLSKLMDAMASCIEPLPKKD